MLPKTVDHSGICINKLANIKPEVTKHTIISSVKYIKINVLVGREFNKLILNQKQMVFAINTICFAVVYNQ